MRQHVITATSRKALGRNDTMLVIRLVSFSVYPAAAAIVVLIVRGVNPTGILTALGELSKALGFSLQDVSRY